jgi:hypothetical protein
MSGEGVGSWGVDGLDRAAAVRRLVALEETGRLGVEQVELAAGGLGVSSRTVWRRSFRGQRYPGWYWSATLGLRIGFES